MPKINSLGRLEHQILSKRIVEALSDIEKEFGVKITSSGGSFANTSGKFRLNVEVQQMSNGKPAAQVEFERMALLQGIKTEWFGRKFYAEGTEYQITGAFPGSPKYAFQVTRVADGKVLKATGFMLKRGMEAAIAAGRYAA